MTALFNGLDVEAYDRVYTDTELIKRIAGYFNPYRKRVIGVVVFMSLVVLAGAGQPLIISRGITWRACMNTRARLF